jgi:hypothetical protein
MTFKYLHIEYAAPANLDDAITINYRLRTHPFVTKWIDCVLRAQQHYNIDDPARFYGFGTLEQQVSASITAINQCADLVAQELAIPIERRLADINDQDTLNYLHHIFEVHHGLLDQQHHSSLANQALCNLNILVHRCESVQRGAKPRHVVTYFGLPKAQQLSDDDYQWFETATKFGTVYLNYVEIGKTLEDLATDNDQYIDDNAFRPFKNYSADFVVRFWDNDNSEHQHRTHKYYAQHQEFFKRLGYSWPDLAKSLGSMPLADIVDGNGVLAQLETRQWVKSVKFS